MLQSILDAEHSRVKLTLLPPTSSVKRWRAVCPTPSGLLYRTHMRHTMVTFCVLWLSTISVPCGFSRICCAHQACDGATEHGITRQLRCGACSVLALRLCRRRTRI